MDKISGANITKFSRSGSTALGSLHRIFVDSQNRIYLTDSLNRVVRMDDMTGAGFKSFGTTGAGTGQFNNPNGIWVDGTARIYVALQVPMPRFEVDFRLTVPRSPFLPPAT